jgi:hypothetical protein
LHPHGSALLFSDGGQAYSAAHGKTDSACGSRFWFGDYGGEFVGSTIEEGKEAWVEGDLDLELVAAAERKTRDGARVILYKKSVDGALIWQATQIRFR